MNIVTSVAIHPLVLLSIVDHYNREIGKKQQNEKRVVGVLLGEFVRGKLDVTNSYAIPFEENIKQGGIWFIDHLYHEKLYEMFKKVNVQEVVVGWYITGTNFKSHDFDMNEIFRKYCEQPVLVRVDVHQQDQASLPFEAYQVTEEIGGDGSTIKKFSYLNSYMSAQEPEEIGIEHLLRDIQDISLSSTSNRIAQKYKSLISMIGKIQQIKKYLDQVLSGKIQANIEIMNNIQQILNLLPNVNQEETQKFFSSKNNDLMYIVYISSLTRSIVSLHTLIHSLIPKQQQKVIQVEEKKDVKTNGEKEKVEDKK